MQYVEVQNIAKKPLNLLKITYIRECHYLR